MMLNVFVIEDEGIMDFSELGDCRGADCKNTSDFSQFTSRNFDTLSPNDCFICNAEE